MNDTDKIVAAILAAAIGMKGGATYPSTFVKIYQDTLAEVQKAEKAQEEAQPQPPYDPEKKE